MAFAKVQSTGKGTIDVNTTLNLIFPSQPTIGNGIIILLSYYGSNIIPVSTASDNQGNTYTLGKDSSPGSTNGRCAILYCSKITTTGTPFTITLTTTGGIYYTACAIEIVGVGGGLIIDGLSSGSGTGTTVDSGFTTPLTVDDIVVAAVCGLITTQTSITVIAQFPSWNQELEELDFSHAVGEGDLRFLTGGSLTTQAGNWTISNSTTWTAAVVAFRALPAPVVTEQTQFVIIMG